MRLIIFTIILVTSILLAQPNDGVSFVSEAMVTGNYEDVKVVEDLLYCANRYGVVVYDLADWDPEDPPIEAARFPTVGTAYGLFIQDSLCFVAFRSVICYYAILWICCNWPVRRSSFLCHVLCEEGVKSMNNFTKWINEIKLLNWKDNRGNYDWYWESCCKVRTWKSFDENRWFIPIAIFGIGFLIAQVVAPKKKIIEAQGFVVKDTDGNIKVDIGYKETENEEFKLYSYVQLFDFTNGIGISIACIDSVSMDNRANFARINNLFNDSIYTIISEDRRKSAIRQYYGPYTRTSIDVFGGHYPSLHLTDHTNARLHFV